jgi:TetR/AcrR family transcriptional repressor of bet genes
MHKDQAVAEPALKTPRKVRKERKENADRRRRQLLDAARASILRHGLAKTTLSTVADEAGLSQGVAVFYFKSKAGLLIETLRDLYQRYEDHWTGALERAGEDPSARLLALIDADFQPAACGPEVLPLWFAFWGELRFQPHYDEVAQAFDARRSEALSGIWRALLSNESPEEADRLAEWTDTLTDGYWQRLHVAPASMDVEAARQTARDCVVRLAPELLAAKRQ